jgi:ComF family protein
MNIKDLIYPPACPFCGELQYERGPCKDCMKSVRELTAIVCHACGASPEDCHCGDRRFAFARNIACFKYEGAPRTMVLRFKQRQKPQLSAFMSRRMYYHIIKRYGDNFDCITFVPQGYSASVRRGFYPVKELAFRLGERMELPVRSLLKRKGNRQQKFAGGSERWENARKNYALCKGAKVSGRVLLIDDLFTSGATLNACAELLRSAGAQEVLCATFAISSKKS